MSKKLDPNKLTFGIKKEFRKDEKLSTITDIESVIEKIHYKPADEEKKLQEEITKRTTLDIEKTLHKRICQRALDKDLTLKDYFLNLAINDLNNG